MKRTKTFLEYNWQILILIFFTIVGDTFHLLFKDIPFKFDPDVNMNAVVYYISAVLGICNLLPSIIIYSLIPKNKISTRTLAFGLILYNLVKLGKEICYANGIPVVVDEIDWIDITEYLGILSTVIVVTVAYHKWKQ